MTVTSTSDLSKSLMLRRDTSRIRADLTRMTHELSSGVSDNLIQKFKGDFGPLAGIERGLARTESYLAVIAERQLAVNSQQLALGKLRELGGISGALLMVQDTGDPALVRNAGFDALSRFTSALNNLNTQVGGQTLFSGVATDRPAVAGSETIMSALEAEIAAAGAVTATDVVAVVTTWFAAGGGFDTVGYIGDAAATQGVDLSDADVSPPMATAQHDAIREFLSDLAVGGLLGRDVLSGDPAEQGQLARLAGEGLLAADGSIVELQAQVGTSEAQIDRARTEVRAESDGLEIAKTNLIGVDLYEAAINLESAESQLQTLFAITARLSRLSLTGYL